MASLLPCLTISPVSATGNVSYGMIEYCTPTAQYYDYANYSTNVNWYIDSNFDWILYPSNPLVVNNFSSLMYAGGKDVILECYFFNQGNFSTYDLTWTDLYNSLLGNQSYYNEAMGYLTTTIDNQGDSNIYAFTISEEEPCVGYNWNASLYNISKFTTVHNQMYADLKVLYPTLKIFPNIHIDEFTNGELTALTKDGLVDDSYGFDIQGVINPWFTRMMTYGGNETYCIVHASGSMDTGAALGGVTPAMVGVTEKNAAVLGVPHLGWYAFNGSTDSKSVLFNTWTASSNPNDPNSAQAYKNEILNILNGVTYSAQIITGNDDAWEMKDKSEFHNNTATWAVGSTGGDWYTYGSGFRFQNVSIPLSANITQSYLSVYANGAYDLVGQIYGEKNISPVDYNTIKYIYTNRTQTTSFVNWSATLDSTDNWSTSVLTTAITQEISNLGRAATFNMNMMVLGIVDAAYNNDSSGYSYEGLAKAASVIHIEYQTSPQAQTKTATVINGTAATLNGRIYSDGGLTTQGRFYYGTSSAYTSNSSLAGSMSMADTFTTTLTGLAKGKHYHYMASANNSLGQGNGSDATFITYPDEPNTLTAVAINDSALTVSFNKGTGATVTAITRKAGSYPANPADGAVVYFDTGTTFDDTGLSASTGYYYRGWSLASDGGLLSMSLTYGEGNGSTDATPVPPATPASIGGTMGTIVVIVFGLIVILMLMGYSYSEYQRQGFTEGAKVAVIGIITIVIAESILIAFF